MLHECIDNITYLLLSMLSMACSQGLSPSTSFTFSDIAKGYSGATLSAPYLKRRKG